MDLSVIWKAWVYPEQTKERRALVLDRTPVLVLRLRVSRQLGSKEICRPDRSYKYLYASAVSIRAPATKKRFDLILLAIKIKNL